MEIDPYSHVSLREHLETVLAERDRLYDQRFRAGESAVRLALAEKRGETLSRSHNLALIAVLIVGLLSFAVSLIALFRHGS